MICELYLNKSVFKACPQIISKTESGKIEINNPSINKWQDKSKTEERECKSESESKSKREKKIYTRRDLKDNLTDFKFWRF